MSFLAGRLAVFASRFICRRAKNENTPFGEIKRAKLPPFLLAKPFVGLLIMSAANLTNQGLKDRNVRCAWLIEHFERHNQDWFTYAPFSPIFGNKNRREAPEASSVTDWNELNENYCRTAQVKVQHPK